MADTIHHHYDRQTGAYAGSGITDIDNATHTSTTDPPPATMDTDPIAVRTGTGWALAAPWVQPKGSHDAYPSGTMVAHRGRVWWTTTSANVWEPGVSGWRDVPEDPNDAPMWVQPTGAHDAYGVGDRVTFNGKVNESAIAANVWSPSAYPAGWKLIT